MAHQAGAASRVVRGAVIDVGTNSVKLLVADVDADGGAVHPVLEQSEQTRLGRGFYETQQLQPEAMAQTAHCVAKFAELARFEGAGSIQVIATSAARDAINQSELVAAISQASGLGVEVISGEREADYAFAGVISDPALAGRALLILDIGGGSTEFIVGRGRELIFRKSFALGSVRLMERIRPQDPPTSEELKTCREAVQSFLAREAGPVVWNHLGTGGRNELELVGTGGAVTILARMKLRTNDFNRSELESTVLMRDWIAGELQRLWAMTLEERRGLPGLPPNRADIILGGVAVLSGVMEEFGFPQARVSTRGLRFGALLSGAQR